MMERFYRPGFTPKVERYCDNPLCQDCELSPSDRVEKLLEYVEVQQDQCDTYQRRACDAEAEVKRLKSEVSILSKELTIRQDAVVELVRKFPVILEPKP